MTEKTEKKRNGFLFLMLGIMVFLAIASIVSVAVKPKDKVDGEVQRKTVTTPVDNIDYDKWYNDKPENLAPAFNAIVTSPEQINRAKHNRTVQEEQVRKFISDGSNEWKKLDGISLSGRFPWTENHIITSRQSFRKVGMLIQGSAGGCVTLSVADSNGNLSEVPVVGNKSGIQEVKLPFVTKTLLVTLRVMGIAQQGFNDDILLVAIRPIP